MIYAANKPQIFKISFVVNLGESIYAISFDQRRRKFLGLSNQSPKYLMNMSWFVGFDGGYSHQLLTFLLLFSHRYTNMTQLRECTSTRFLSPIKVIPLPVAAVLFVLFQLKLLLERTSISQFIYLYIAAKMLSDDWWFDIEVI